MNGGDEMKVFFHSRTEGKYDWVNRSLDVEQVPAVGEYFNLGDSETDITHVQMVIHTPFPGADYQAEVFGIWISETDAMRKALTDVYED